MVWTKSQSLTGPIRVLAEGGGGATATFPHQKRNWRLFVRKVVDSADNQPSPRTTSAPLRSGGRFFVHPVYPIAHSTQQYIHTIHTTRQMIHTTIKKGQKVIQSESVVTRRSRKEGLDWSSSTSSTNRKSGAVSNLLQ